MLCSIYYLLSTGHSSPATASTGSEQPGAGVSRKGAGRGGLWVWLWLFISVMRSKVQYCCQKRAYISLGSWFCPVRLQIHDAPNLINLIKVMSGLLSCSVSYNPFCAAQMQLRWEQERILVRKTTLCEIKDLMSVYYLGVQPPGQW